MIKLQRKLYYMTLKQLFIIDPWDKLHIQNDTTVHIMNQGILQSHTIHTCTEYDLYVSNKGCFASVQHHTSPINESIRQTPSNQTIENLETYDYIHIRKDPPFDDSYISLLWLLKDLQHPYIINNPISLLIHNEKLATLLFPEYAIDSLVTSNIDTIEKFLCKFKKVVLKPLTLCSGRGIELLDIAMDWKQIALQSTNNQTKKVLLQRYLPQIQDGETRVFMVDETPLAVMKKIPKAGSFKANFDFGASGIPYELTPHEQKLCKTIGTYCKQHKLHFTALDIIGGYISEINMTSPGLLMETTRIYNYNYAQDIIQYLEENREKNK
ncbi:MAG: hypothetical protein KBC30_03030 [Planctomycetes bacterium]|nr:hypothetical protein [Planctomycetota bacterium]HQB00064.1 hypothetical protein [Planctomycetota bacterium]